MRIKWYGHSCFLLTTDTGVRLLTDPCAPPTGYRLSGIPADVITSSHAHYDHNYFVAAAGAPEIVNTAGAHDFRDVRITGFPAFHDDAGGAKRGANIIYRIEADGLRLVHLGDLGHVPDAALARRLGPVDVLFIPIGGTFTIDAAAARETAALLRPRVLIPMHYQTPALAFELGGLDPFLRRAKDWRVHRLNEDNCILTADTLGEDRIVVFDYANAG